MRHDVAPVTGRVADRQQDRNIALSRPLQGIGTPLLPVHRIGGVLAHWDGRAWQTQAVEMLPANTTLTAMAVAGPHDIWLVGATDLPTGPVPTAVPTIGPPGPLRTRLE